MKKVICLLAISFMITLGGCQKENEVVKLSNLSMTKSDVIENHLSKSFKPLKPEKILDEVVVSKSKDSYNVLYKRVVYFDHIIKLSIISKDLNSNVNMVILEYPEMYFDVVDKFLKTFVPDYHGEIKGGDNIFGNIKIHSRKNILTSAKKLIISNLDDVNVSLDFDDGNDLKTYFDSRGDLVYLLNFDEYGLIYLYKDFINNFVDLRGEGKYKGVNFYMSYMEANGLGSYSVVYKDIKDKNKMEEIKSLLEYKFNKKDSYTLVEAGSTLTLEYKTKRK